MLEISFVHSAAKKIMHKLKKNNKKHCRLPILTKSSLISPHRSYFTVIFYNLSMVVFFVLLLDIFYAATLYIQ